MGSLKSKSPRFPDSKDNDFENGSDEQVIPDNLYLLETGDNSDVILLCEDEKLLVHKKILSPHSDVFQSIFADMKETGNVIHVTDVVPVTLKQMLHFLYSGKLPQMSINDSLKLYGASKRYEIHCLQRKCLKKVEQVMKDDNVCEILLHAESKGFVELKDKVILYFVKNKGFLTSETWEEYSRSHMESANRIMLAIFKKIQK